MSQTHAGQEPKYGEWPAEALRELIRLKIESDGGAEKFQGSTRQSRLAMIVSQLTGCSYPWAWNEVEKLCGGPRVG